MFRLGQPHTVAAIDLGSNSFHMVVARVVDGQVLVVDRMREMVRLGAGLDASNRLTRAAQDAAIACLERFGQRLRGMSARNVRAVGTNTLRRARNAGEFLAAARRALGHPIEVIAGREEARLIYLGVAHGLAGVDGRRLVMDIGGGSTELIIGERFEPVCTESLHMGCVGMSREHFPDGAITRAGMRRAEIAARLELQPIESEYRQRGWQSAVGASGTILAAAAIVQAAGWNTDGITPEALRKLRDALFEAGHVERLRLSGLSRERAPVFPGGLAILLAAFDALGIQHMRVSESALREGLLYDLLGRIRHEDVRERAIQTLSTRYQIDKDQALRVERTARVCFTQAAPAWGLNDDDVDVLAWAARLHEIGLAVAHSQYHKHGAYLLENSDLPGFSHQEQKLLAILVRSHRRKFPSEAFDDPAEPVSGAAHRLCVLLRLAALLHRARANAPLPGFSLLPNAQHLYLKFPDGWLAEHPLTEADLHREAEYLKATKIKLRFS